MITPIRDPIDYKCTNYLKKILPPQEVIDSFLFYSGKLEFSMAKADRIMRVHTNKYVVYEFWHCMQEDPHRIVEIAQHLHSQRNPYTSLHLQDMWYRMKDHYVRAALFFLLNAYSKEGLVSSGHQSYESFSPLLFNRLKGCSFENVRINFYKDENMLDGLDYVEGGEYLLLPLGKYSYNLFEEGKSYGPESTPVDHQATKLKVDKTNKKNVILYKAHKEVFKLYNDYNLTMIDKFGNKASTYDECEEVVIANF